MKLIHVLPVFAIAAVYAAMGPCLSQATPAPASTAPAPAPVPTPWPHEKSDLTPDQSAIWGRLDNGFRYVILPNKFPVKERASMRLYVDAGSLMEEDDQQGMAHFLEHMAFNGTKNFPAGTMVETFQRMGMAFGADTNAHTSFKETVYKLELPKVDEAMLTDGLRLFRDDLDGMLLSAEEVDRERGIILSEKLARDSVESRIMEEGYKFALPESTIPFRMPIGIEETIKKMPRERFVDFYEKWYTPERSVLVVVGDVDVALVEKLIHKYFADAVARRGNSPDPSLGKVSTGRGLVAKLYTDMEAPAVELSMETHRTPDQKADSIAKRRADMIRNLADAMINQRLSLLAKEEGTPLIEAQSYNYEMFEFVEIHGIYAKSKPEDWKPALTLIERELRRAVQFGFTSEEFAEATANYLKTVRLRAEQKDTRKNADLANGLVRQLGRKQVFTDPVDDLKRVEIEIAAVTAEDCVDALRDSWSTKDIQVFVGGKLELPEADKTIAAALVESAGVPVEPPSKQEKVEFAYQNFGEAGKVAKKNVVEDLGIVQAVFENEVRVNLKKTEFEKNSIRMTVNFGAGKLQPSADKPGIIPYAQGVFQAGGLEKHSADELRRLFAGKEVGVEFAVGDDSFVLGGKTTPVDLQSQLELLCAYVMAPGFREEADRQFKRNLDSVYNELNKTAEGVIQNEVTGFIKGSDPRFLFPVRAVMEQRTMAELKAWMADALKEGYMEIAIVGDIDEEKTLEAIGKTFGALPKRLSGRPDDSEARKIAFPKEPRQKTFNFTTEIPRAYALAYWPTADMMDIKRTRRLVLLGQILDDRLRLKIREELGETYSPASYHNASDTFTDFGYMTAMASLKPEQVALVEPMFLEIGAEIGAKGITDDEFKRAQEPQLQQIVQMRRDNRYWLQRVLVNSQAQAYRLDWSRSLENDITTIKREELEALAKEFLGAERAITIGVIPAAAAAPASTSTAPSEAPSPSS
ncbi:insulinase family protein [Phragmitibacter flavus]|uniref:Insulinase family protein n=1 Tax=Phragmitibacter flavus TaxID=2576071 RepID=A0A5R8K9B8_9BACT|nr:insulinase family protein [Phragmitibacter flavus]TLD68908.1 insulinase family protein [Phragmitibacter flavus]